MAISAKDVMNLRKKSGLGMMECKAALEEAGGDMAVAEENLRKKGLAKMDGRADRESAEGRVAAAVCDDASQGALVEVNTETDFTAKNDAFGAMVDQIAAMGLGQASGDLVKSDAMQAAIDEIRLTTKENVQFAKGAVFGGEGKKVGSYVHFTGKLGVLVECQGDAPAQLLKDLCMHISAITPAPLGLSEEDIPAEIVEKEKEIAKGQAIEQGKPEAIAEKMVVGKIRKYYDDVVLLRQKFIKDDSKQIKDLLPAGVTITRFARYQVGN